VKCVGGGEIGKGDMMKDVFYVMTSVGSSGGDKGWRVWPREREMERDERW